MSKCRWLKISEDAHSLGLCVFAVPALPIWCPNMCREGMGVRIALCTQANCNAYAKPERVYEEEYASEACAKCEHSKHGLMCTGGYGMTYDNDCPRFKEEAATDE